MGVKLPKARRAEVAMQIPTSAQVSGLIDGADIGHRAFVALAAFAGLRLGEVWALKVEDIDFLRRVLHVRRQVQKSARKQEIRPPKYGSERDVYLADDLVVMLSEHIASNWISPAGWLFPNRYSIGPLAGPQDGNSVGEWWTKARKNAGAEGVRFHDLRRYFASGLIAAGCDVVTVQKAMGHRSAAVTLSVYSHLWPTAEDKTRSAVQHMMETALQKEEVEAR